VTNGKLLSAIASGNPPDLVVVNNEYAGAVIGYQGGLTDLTPYLKTVGWKPSQMLPAILQLMQYGNKIWTLPETCNLSFFYYNKTLFKQAGISSPPTTLTQVQADAAKLTKKSCMALRFPPHPTNDPILSVGSPIGRPGAPLRAFLFMGTGELVQS